MKKQNTKTITFGLILVLTLSAIVTFFPVIFAQENWKATHTYIGATPNPVGVNQETLLHIGMTDPLPSTELGWELTVTITRPDGETEILGPFTTDSTGGTGAIYVPTMVGTYTIQSHFEEQVMPDPGTRWTPGGTIMRASDSQPLDLIVQDISIEYHPGFPSPTEYWTRPIDAQMREWYSISGSWPTIPDNQHALYNEDAPESSHILWAKPLEMGGLVGGLLGPHSFDHGDAYEGRFATGVKASVILAGVLYYNKYKVRNPTQEVVAVNLRTGKELWTNSLLDSNGTSHRLAFGQTFYWDSFNLHGAFAYLWAVDGSTWHAFDPNDGNWIYTMDNVPSVGDASIGRQVPAGHIIYGSNGEMYRYTVNLDEGWMTLWNSTKVVNEAAGGFTVGSWRPEGNVYDATLGIEWNITIPSGLTGMVRAILDDRLIGMTRNRLGAPLDTDADDPIRFWAISTEQGQEGDLKFDTTWQQPSGNLTIDYFATSKEDGVFIMAAKETRAFFGFDINTGNQLWGPTESQQYLNQFDLMTAPDYPLYAVADGMFYSTGFGGIVYAYDVQTGNRVWAYEIEDPYREILWSNNWPALIAFVADEKVYIAHYEHSPVDPLPRGAPFAALDAKTGEVLWRIQMRSVQWGGQPIIGDSIIAIFNSYDNRIYALGKGPSAITASAPDNSLSLGSSVTIKGKVTDVSPGALEYESTSRFPNGVPVVADESMDTWMNYVYMQYPSPTNVMGVTLKFEAIDPNGNYQNLGTTTSDIAGNFGFTFEPEVPGQYMVIVTFEGSDSYYGSFTTTYLTVDPASESSTPIEPEQPATETPLITTEVAIIVGLVAIAITGIAAYWLIKRK